MTDLTTDERAAQHGIAAQELPPRLARACVEVNGTVYSSGHTSGTTGQVITDVSLDSAIAAARESLRNLLVGVLSVRGTLNDLRLVRLLGCVNAPAGFTDHPEIMNEASRFALEVFGEARGQHARSALGFTSLPGGATVEIEAIFVVD